MKQNAEIKEARKRINQEERKAKYIPRGRGRDRGEIGEESKKERKSVNERYRLKEREREIGGKKRKIIHAYGDVKRKCAKYEKWRR